MTSEGAGSTGTQGLVKALKGTERAPESMNGNDKDEIIEKAHNALLLLLCLGT